MTGNSKPRVLFCIYSHNTWGGIEDPWARRLASDLEANGWDVVFGLARGRRFNDPEGFRRANPGSRTVEIDGRTGTPEGRILAVQRALALTNPHLVVPLGLADVFPAVGRLKRQGVSLRLAVALHAINAGIFSDVREFAPIIDYCVGVNPLQAHFLAEWSGLPADRLATVLHGTPIPSTRRKESRTPRSPLRILFAGRLDQVSKHVLEAVPLAVELSRRGVPFEFTFAGSGESEEDLRRAFRGAGIEGIRFLGYVSSETLHREVYPAHDVLIIFSPASGEAAVLVLLEAMAHGVVPVSTEFIGVHSLGYLQAGVTACIYECGDISAAAAAIERLWREPETRMRMSAAGQAMASHLSIDESNANWRQAFKRVLELPVRGLGVTPGVLDLESERGAGRLDKILGVRIADRARRALRRWPEFSDGWAEWPGTLTAPDAMEEREMWAELRRLDRLACDESLRRCIGGSGGES